jgi:acetyl esterase/lipase
MSGKRPKPEKWPGVDEKDISITVRDGHVSRARVYSPTKSGTEGRPLLVMLYGGAWVLGSLEQQEENCRHWVKRHGGVGISIEHRWVCSDW